MISQSLDILLENTIENKLDVNSDSGQIDVQKSHPQT